MSTGKGNGMIEVRSQQEDNASENEAGESKHGEAIQLHAKLFKFTFLDISELSQLE